MNRLIRLFRTSIGRKLLMAATGLMLIGFLVIHLLGNLAVFQKPEEINAYAAWLQSHPLIWVGRLGLLAVFAFHVLLGIRLARENRQARPIRYAKQVTQATTNASRTMILTGLLIVAFVIYHLLHFTFGVVDGDSYGHTDSEGRPDVHRMMVLGFRQPLVAASYVVAMLILGLHLLHGVKSFFQTLGISHESYEVVLKVVAVGIVTVIVVGNLSIPVLILAGVVPLAGEGTP